MSVRLCPNVTVRSSIDTAGQIELGFGTETSFPLSYAVLQRNSGIFKIRVGLVLSGTLSQILGLFRHGKSIACQQNSSTVELVDHTYHGRRIVDVYYTSVDCNGPFIHMLRVPALRWRNVFTSTAQQRAGVYVRTAHRALTHSLLRFVVDLLYNLFLG